MSDSHNQYFIKEEKANSIFDSLAIPVFVSDREGSVKYYNPAVVQLLTDEPELGTDRWYGDSILYHSNGTLMNHEENLIVKFLDESDSSEGDRNLVLKRPDGEEIWLKIYSSWLYNEEREKMGAIHMLVDVTNQKELEQQYRRNEEELINFFNNAAVGLQLIQSDGTIKRANQAVLDMLGYTREEFVGSHIADFLVDRERFDEFLKKLSAGEEIRDFELRMRHKNGSVRHVVVNSNGYWKGGEFIHSYCIMHDITEQKEARAELRDITDKYYRQERLYEGIISSTPDLMYVFDLDYRFIFANDALLEMWGLTEDEYMHKSLREIGYEEWHAEMHEREIDQVIATKEPIQGEVAFHHAKLGKRVYEYIFVPVLNSDKEVEAIAGTTRDITSHKEAEKKFRRNEEKYRTLVENFPNGAVGMFDKDLRYTAVGGKLVDSTGVDPDDRIGRQITDIYPEELVEKVEPYFHAALSGETNTFEADFHGRRLVAKALPVEDEDGEVVAGMLVVMDITERWQAQQDLLKSEEKYRSLFKSMNEGFAVIQMEFDENNEPVNFHFLETNPAYRKHSGLENVEGKSAKEVIPDLGKDMLRRNGKIALTGEPFHSEIYVDEINRWLDLSSFRIGEPEERKVAVIFTDITERKQAQKELKLMNETLEERVEKRTQSLLSYQEKLRSLAFQLSRTEEKQRQQLATELHDNLGQMLALGKMKVNELQNSRFAEEIAPAVDELQKIMDNAIKYTRELTSDLKPPPSVTSDIKASINWLTEKIAEHGIEIVIDDDEQPKPLDDEVRMTVIQSVRELLFNVIKHTSEKKATVRLRRSEEQLQITVEDEGEGFDLENKELASAENGRFGLFNIHERIKLLGGRVDIEAKKGRGSKVTLRVPLSKARSDIEKMKQSEGETGKKAKLKEAKPGEKTKVLLVDDHKMFRNGLRKIIEEEDDIMVVGEAANGEEAVTLSLEMLPDVILMDVSMPKMDGIEATKQIKAKMTDVRIIGVSLHDSRKIMRDMRNAGASAYLTKTEAFESLIITIRAEASATKG